MEWTEDVFMDNIKKDAHYLKNDGKGVWGDGHTVLFCDSLHDVGKGGSPYFQVTDCWEE